MNAFQLVQFQSEAELASAAASAWLDEIETANRAGKAHWVALSGGRIAPQLFASAAEQAKKRSVSLDHVHFFWADERCVPQTDTESNFRLARDLLFSPLNISEETIHRIQGEELPEKAAKQAEAEMRRVISPKTGLPVLDLVFLGLGEDGHIASLFPGEPEELISSNAVYRAILNSPKPPLWRVTLGYQAITTARQVWMLATGRGKRAVLMESLAPAGRTPFAWVLKKRCQTKIYTDIVVE
jgi:6-phosphogluconolactonase